MGQTDIGMGDEAGQCGKTEVKGSLKGVAFSCVGPSSGEWRRQNLGLGRCCVLPEVRGLTMQD